MSAGGGANQSPHTPALSLCFIITYIKDNAQQPNVYELLCNYSLPLQNIFCSNECVQYFRRK